MPSEHPYPNPFEILRYLLRSLDLKLSNKRLDELSAKNVYDPRELQLFIEQSFSGTLYKYLGKAASDIASEHITKSFDQYLFEIAGKIPADGLNRATMLEILIQTFIKDHLIELLLDLNEKIGGPNPSIWFTNEVSTTKVLFDWLKRDIPGWEQYLLTLTKERRDMTSSWARGKELPSAQSIFLLSETGKRKNTTEIALNWDQIRPLLFLARAIDFVKQNTLGIKLLDECRLALWGATNQSSTLTEVQTIQEEIQRSMGPNLQLVAKLQHDLRRTKEKKDPLLYRELIDQLRLYVMRSKQLQSTQYWIDWHDARWHVFNGEPHKANELYKQAFEGSLFLSGENQRDIIEESVVIAASLPNPDKVFLKQLKWSQINFGYDIASNSSKKPSQKVSDTVENWEIDLWKSNFQNIFPSAGLFPGIDYSTSTHDYGPLMFSNSSGIKPDYRNPNRKIKIGETWKRVMPQLVWFTLNENNDVCEKLLTAGATVNCQSEVGDTPILLALETLNVTAIPWRTLDDRVFNLISNQVHNEETLNIRTQKKRLLPIISAVETGRPEIVDQILKMGADPNGRGLTDEQTALNVCLKRIGMIKNPERYWKIQNSMAITPEILDSIRRHSSGLSGFTLNHQEQFMKNLETDNISNEISTLLKQLMTERILEKMSITSMRKIAKLLIKSGADVNAEHLSPIKGYTPLMLATELDEREIFDAMLIAEGNIQKKYRDPVSNREISIIEIAQSFNSTEIEKTLTDIAPYINLQ